MREPERSALDAQPTPQATRARSWRRYLRFWRAQPDADVDDELRFHMDMRVRDYMARGLGESAAHAAAEQRFGDYTGIEQELITMTTRRERSSARAQWFDGLVQDIRFALRGFGRQRGWTAVAILTLALGIGANTATFSAVNSLILHPVSYPHADRIVMVWQEPNQGASTAGVVVRMSATDRDLRYLEGATHSFEDLQAYTTNDLTVEEREGGTSTMHGAFITPTFLRFAGERMLRGRMFTSADSQAHAPVALLSEATWRSRYGADPGVLGRTITVNDTFVTIIGITPASLRLPRMDQANTDLWLPLQSSRSVGYSLIGRLRPGVTLAQATRELDGQQLLHARDAGRSVSPVRATLMRPREMLSFRTSLLLLSGAVALVLLIACTNVAHLLLARSASRQRELAIRRALGAALARLFRQMITESLVLALAGSAAGIVVGWLTIRMLVRLRPESLAALSVAHIDPVVLFTIVGVAVACGIGFGLFAAVQAGRHSTNESLKTGALSTSQSRQHHRMRSLLVVTEMALSTTLLVGASLLVRSVMHLQMAPLGFEPRGLYALDVTLPKTRYATDASQRLFYDGLVSRVRAAPGVESIAFATSAPPGFSFRVGALQADGEAEPPAGANGFIRAEAVSPDYFRTMRLPVVEGRAFADSAADAGAVMINEGFARAHWPGVSAIGKRLRFVDFGGHSEWLTVVGVAAGAATGGLTDDRSSPMLYTPAHEDDRTLIVRANAAVDLLPALRAIVTSLDPHLPPPKLTNVEEAMRATAAEPRFTMALLVGFTVLALVLAAIGLYGVMSYAVAQRTREIGIRIALGATRRDVSRDVVWRGVALAGIGALLGLVAAWWATKVVEQMLYGVTRTDPLSFAIGGVVLIATAVVACVVPMRRAAGVDPLIAMKAD